MSDYKVNLSFNQDFKGTLETNNSRLTIGMEQGDFRPYQLLFGAMGSCFYATFLEISKKMRLTFKTASLIVDGNKRITVPQTLEDVYVSLTIKDASDQLKIEKAAKLGLDHCSIVETIRQVATVHLEVKFI